MELTDINEIQTLLARHGFHFSKARGQNFLTERWVPEQIAESAGLDRDTGVLEVGPGIGCLTAELSARAGRTVAVELDRRLEPLLRETVGELENVELIFADALKLDLAAVAGERLAGLRPVICANLPYNITSPLLTAFIRAECFDSITVMIQREVAKRICAVPGSADYGAFGVFVGWHMEAELLFEVPPCCFVPRPKVTSAVIRLVRRERPPAGVMDEELMFSLIRAAFNQRRKTLANAMCSALGDMSKDRAEAILTSCGFDTKIRGETLDVVGFAKIADEICRVRDKDL